MAILEQNLRKNIKHIIKWNQKTIIILCQKMNVDLLLGQFLLEHNISLTVSGNLFRLRQTVECHRNMAVQE